MRKSFIFIVLILSGTILLAGLIGLYPTIDSRTTARRIEGERHLVSRLGLTDICLFTEAAYTRHPNLADRFVPFQNHPMATSLFPSESLLGPPTHLLKAISITEKGDYQ